MSHKSLIRLVLESLEQEVSLVEESSHDNILNELRLARIFAIARIVGSAKEASDISGEDLLYIISSLERIIRRGCKNGLVKFLLEGLADNLAHEDRPA